MPKRSAGLLMYRHRGEALEVFLVHPGGPFWRKKDLGVWSIPKGEYSPEEDPLEAARREFHEETGLPAAEAFRNCARSARRAGNTSGPGLWKVIAIPQAS
jgi:predicted NUDIX family NTP pyrophosphohydrolase